MPWSCWQREGPGRNQKEETTLKKKNRKALKGTKKGYTAGEWSNVVFKRVNEHRGGVSGKRRPGQLEIELFLSVPLERDTQRALPFPETIKFVSFLDKMSAKIKSNGISRRQIWFSLSRFCFQDFSGAPANVPVGKLRRPKVTLNSRRQDFFSPSSG